MDEKTTGSRNEGSGVAAGEHGPEQLVHDGLGAIAGIGHGFFTRRGGVSGGIYESLNVGIGSQDDAAHIRQNRELCAATLGLPADRLATPFQIHSPDVFVVTEPFGEGEKPRVDALVTDRPSIALGIVTADCGPVLFASRDGAVVGAAHAGWRGAFSGVLERTIEAMEGLGATRGSIIAVLGPSIRQDNYEVDDTFRTRFVEADPSNERWFRPSDRPGHAMFDLPGYSLQRLREAGVEAHETGQCTYGQPQRFFSYRRTTHAGEKDYGRQLSAIAIAPKRKP